MKLHRYIYIYMVMPVVLAATAAVSSCEKAESMFSGYRAYFRFTPVSAKPNLHRACTSLGEFCSITFPIGDKYLIKSPSTPSVTDEILPTAIQGYNGGYILGIGNGLIVGMPMIPEMLEQESQVTCYDICCPNCYQEHGIQKHTELHVGGISTCASCQRSYDLNNLGIVTKGEPGRSLFRYYAYYYQPTQTLTIDNK